VFGFFKKIKEKRLKREEDRRKTIELFDKIFESLEKEREEVIIDLEGQIRSKLNEEEGYDYVKNPD
jgi:hypothetical protein